MEQLLLREQVWSMRQKIIQNKLTSSTVISVGTRREACTEQKIQTTIPESKMRRLFQDLKSDKSGVTMIEYALIAGLISVVAIALLSAMGTSVLNIFTSINNALTTA